MAESCADRVNPTRSPIATRNSGRKTKFAAKNDENSVESEKRMPFEEVESGNHPSFADMIVTAIRKIKDPEGSTRSSILKFILTQFGVQNSVEFVQKRMAEEIKIALKSGRLLYPGYEGEKPNFCRLATPNCRLNLTAKEERITSAEDKRLLNLDYYPLVRRKSGRKRKIHRSKVMLEEKVYDSAEAKKSKNYDFYNSVDFGFHYDYDNDFY